MHVMDDAPLSTFHKKLALFSSGGPFLDGYVLSIIGVALVQITPQLGLSGTVEGLVGASALIGIFLGAFLGGWLTDKFGRKLLFTIDLIAMVRVHTIDQVATTVAERVNKVPGVEGTETHIAFRAYSTHDLEAAFAIGAE